ncbi:MAG TPA: M14 family metallopeptidase [Alphaproteobacteria bacterium]|jgi:hypothetical protein|nr:M14 family metallopeptidase [Alphaproteobacteria bacterium]
MSISQYFARDYADARAKFLAAARGAGAVLRHYQNPLRGPNGERLFTDVAWYGPTGAERVLMTISGTHGNEGFCGSGIQVGWFECGLHKELPASVALVAVHAVNPHGFAWVRRVTEDNVDLNRNFVDYAAPLPDNPGYCELAEAICPAEWSDATCAASRALFEAYAKKNGAMALQTALSGGQYSHPLGIFFGGHAPTWSRRTMIVIAKQCLASAEVCAVVDYHTGLGPYGYGELISVLPPDGEAFARTRDWLDGEVTSPNLGSSRSVVVVGANQHGIASAVPDTKCAAIALEYGTFSLEEVLEALRADNWLHANGDLDSPLGRKIKNDVRRALYPDKDDWREMVWERAIDVNRKLLRGLAAS